MALTIEIGRDLEAVLAAQARAKGVPLDTYVKDVLEREAASGEGHSRMERLQAADRIREPSKEIQLGPDLTVRDLIQEGLGFEPLRPRQLGVRGVVFWGPAHSLYAGSVTRPSRAWRSSGAVALAPRNSPMRWSSPNAETVSRGNKEVRSSSS